MSPLLGLIPGVGGHLELLIIGAVALLLFGHRLPYVMRAIGSSINSFRAGLSESAVADDPTGRKMDATTEG